MSGTIGCSSVIVAAPHPGCAAHQDKVLGDMAPPLRRIPCHRLRIETLGVFAESLISKHGSRSCEFMMQVDGSFHLRVSEGSRSQQLGKHVHHLSLTLAIPFLDLWAEAALAVYDGRRRLHLRPTR
jgi:hypothetical protein